MPPRNPRRDFVTSPTWMALCVLVYAWTAASSGTPAWLRLVATAFGLVWLALLTRTVAYHRRARRSADRRSSGT